MLHPPNAMTPLSFINHALTLLEKMGPQPPLWSGYEVPVLMLRQGKHFEPLVNAGQDGRNIFVETWSSYELRSIASDIDWERRYEQKRRHNHQYR